MKTYRIIAVLFAISLFLGGCEDTNENLVGSRGIAVVPQITDINPAFYTSDLANSYVAFNVDLPEGASVDAAEVQVTYKGETVVLQQIASFPATVELQALDVIDALGVAENEVAIDDFFLVHVVTTSQGVSSRSLAAMKVFVTCQFDPALTTGSYHFVSDDWAAAGDVTFTADPADPYTIFVEGIAAAEGLVDNGNKLELHIDPSSFKVTGVTTVLADDLEPWGLTYKDYYYETIGGLYKSCDGSFQMQFKIGVDVGSWGTFNFEFTRN